MDRTRRAGRSGRAGGPGVATRMSTPDAQPALLRAERHAAEHHGGRERQPAAIGRKLSAIWLASSRVGLSTSTRQPPRGGAAWAGRRDGAGSGARRRRSCRCRSGRCRTDRGRPLNERDRLRLDRGRRDVALIGEGIENGRKKSEIVKTGQECSSGGIVAGRRAMRTSGRETTRVIRAVWICSG